MDISKYINICYSIAKSKGFYPDDSKIEDHLMGIISEINEAYEAHRKEIFANTDMSEFDLSEWDRSRFIPWFKKHVKDSYGDELADVFIRLFNLMAHYKLNPKDKWFLYGINSVDINEDTDSYDNRSKFKLEIIKKVAKLENDNDGFYIADIGQVLRLLQGFCNYYNIPIEKHIIAKIEYNKTREHLHGKKY